MTLFQTIFVPLCALMSLVTLSRTLRGHVPRRNGYAWGIIWLAAAGFIAVPNSTTTVARWLGIGRGTDLLLYIAILAGLATSLHFYTRYRRLESLLTVLVRRQALGVVQQGKGAPRSTPMDALSPLTPLTNESAAHGDRSASKVTAV